MAAICGASLGAWAITVASTLTIRQPASARRRDDVAQQAATVGAGPALVVVGEQVADIAQRAGAEQRIAERMKQHIAVGVGDETVIVGDAYTADHQMVAIAEAMDVEAVADSHHARVSQRLRARVVGVGVRRVAVGRLALVAKN